MQVFVLNLRSALGDLSWQQTVEPLLATSRKRDFTIGFERTILEDMHAANLGGKKRLMTNQSKLVSTAEDHDSAEWLGG